MELVECELKKVVKRLFGEDVEVGVSETPEGVEADYASNVAMKLAKSVHKAPLAIAEEIKAEFENSDNFKVEVATPGFLNFTVNNKIFAERVEDLAEEGVVCQEKFSGYDGKKIVTEFSDPNPFKVLHVGHLYTSIVGDSISRLLEFAGAKVARVNFGGDVGLHVGKTMYGILQKQYRPDDLTIEEIAQCYVEGTRAYEEDESARPEIVKLNKQIYEIAENDIREGQVAELYWRGRELSYDYFEKFYQRIGVKFDKFYPESKVAPRGLEEVRAHVGNVYEESDGAVVFKGEKVGLHTRVFINREGVPTYEAKDVGLIFTKWDDYGFDKSLVITGNEIIDYMKVVLASVGKYASELVERTEHLTHGMVKLPGSVKMSSRKGNFLKAVDVLEMVKELVDGDEILALAAIKYAFLKYKMGGDIVFDVEESVSTTGNSGIYLLYAAVRAKKILAKVKVGAEIGAIESDERDLCKKLVEYDDVLKNAVDLRAPYKVCNYLYELAQEFSRFYENVKVAGSEREAERGMMVQAYLQVMEHGLQDILGIKIPESM